MNTAFFVNLFLFSKNEALEGKQDPCLTPAFSSLLEIMIYTGRQAGS